MYIKGNEIRNVSNNLITILCSSEYVKLYVGMRVWWPKYILLGRCVSFFCIYFRDDYVLCDGKCSEYKRNVTLNSVRQHNYFITQGNYTGYVFRL